MSANKIILTIVLALGACTSGVAQTAATVQAPPGNSTTVASTTQNTTSQSENNLPATGSSLPLLSVIGFGVLVGGIASALKTR
jgi:LPXTG-motif cell wall-anchored protein